MAEPILYFSDKCSDTAAFKAALAAKHMAYQEVNITESMANLKAFLAMRDQVAVFDAVKAAGRVGVPVLVTVEGQYIFDKAEL